MESTLPDRDALTPEQARTALHSLGAQCALDDITLQRRGDRWFAFLPDDRVVVFPVSVDPRERGIRERRVLHALARRCSFAAPRILAEAPDVSCDLRAMVPGAHDVDAVLARVRNDPLVRDTSARPWGT